MSVASARLNVNGGTTGDKVRHTRPSTSPSHLQTAFRSTYVFTTRPSTAPGTPSSPGLPEKQHVPVYPSVLKQPFSDALEVLCHAFNLEKLAICLRAQDSIPPIVDMQLVDQDMYDSSSPTPTHALVVLDTPRTIESTGRKSVPHPLIVPINVTDFDQVFNSDLLRHYYAAHKSVDSQPIPYNPMGVVRLPTIVARVPHPPSFPLLVLFGLAPHLKLAHTQQSTLRSPLPSIHVVNTPLTPMTPSNSSCSGPISDPSHPTPSISPNPRDSHHSSTTHSSFHSFSSPHSTPPTTPSTSSTSFSSTTPKNAHTTLPTGLLAAYLLPTSVIEEFPAASMMSETLARTAVSSDEELQTYFTFNQGMWRNVLLLAPQDTRIVEIVRVAWNVTAEARKDRDRWKNSGGGTESEGGMMMMMSASARRRERRRRLGPAEDSESSDEEVEGDKDVR